MTEYIKKDSAPATYPCPLCEAGVPLTTGTMIRFTKTLEEGPSEDHPGRQYARAGQLGCIVEVGTVKEGYWVRTLDWEAGFGASPDEFRPLREDELIRYNEIKAAIKDATDRDLYDVNEHFTNL